MKQTSIKFFVLIILIFSMAMKPVKKQKVIFFGDSITQMGVNANGYITKAREMLTAKGLGEQFELNGSGIGGNKVYDLYLRMEEDVLAKNPDVVVIWVGVNDVWHKSSFGTGTDADKFEKFYVAIIKKLQARNIKVIVTTPTTIGERTDFTNPQDGDLNSYSSILRKVAKENNCGLVDLRKVFLDYNLIHNTSNKDLGILTLDRVHLNDSGNMLVAEKMVEMLTK